MFGEQIRKDLEELNKGWGNCQKCQKRDEEKYLKPIAGYPDGVCEDCFEG